MSDKRIIVIGDLHCGHRCGITPPDFQGEQPDGSGKETKWNKIRLECWHEYDRLLRELAPFDHLFVMGDCIDGKGKRSGGTELIQPTLAAQKDMAVETINHARVVCGRRKLSIVGVYGTSYHVASDGEDMEDAIKKACGFTKYGAHEWPEVNGAVFDLKHKIGSSSIPHGRHTAVARDLLWNSLWYMLSMQPKAAVLLRAHVHYFTHCGTAVWSGFTTPALQAMGSKFGAREMSGTVDWGLMHFDVSAKGAVDWHAHCINITAQRAEVTVL